MQFLRLEAENKIGNNRYNKPLVSGKYLRSFTPKKFHSGPKNYNFLGKMNACLLAPPARLPACPLARPLARWPSHYLFGWIRKLFEPFFLLFEFFSYDTFFLKIHTGQTNRPKQFLE